MHWTQKDKTISVKLRFITSEILDDVKQYAWVSGDLMSPEDGAGHARHQTQDITEKGNLDRVTRMLNLSMARCREALYPFTKRAVDSVEPERNDILVLPQEYLIGLEVPDTFSKTTADLLEQYIHEYCVASILADWFSITNPSSVQSWQLRAENAMHSINTSLSIRTGRIRRGKSPF